MHHSIWNKIENGVDNAGLYGSTLDGLHGICTNSMKEYVSEVHLWLSVLIMAAKDRDFDFVNTYGAKICGMAGLNYNAIKQLFQAAWEIEKSDANYQE